MKYRYAGIIFALAFILQTTVFGMLPVFGVSANLLLCCCIVISFACTDNNAGFVISLIAGLLYDVCFSQYMGVTALLLVLIAAGCIAVRTFLLNSENFMSMLVTSLGSVFVYYNLLWLIYRLAGSSYSYLYMLEKLPVYIILNVIIIMIMYAIIIRKVVSHKSDRYSVWGGY